MQKRLKNTVLDQAVELPRSVCSIFRENASLFQIKVNITNHDFGPDYNQTTLAQITWITPNWIYKLYWKFFHRSRFLSRLRWPWKNRVALKFLLCLIYLSGSGFLTTCACPENRVCPEIFHCIEYIFYHSGFLSNFALVRKNSCPEIFHCIEYTFYIQDFWGNFACPEKQSSPSNFSLYWICIFYHSGYLGNLRLPWKTELP